ncbi:MAG: hypothetical protein A2277_00280 [Desulfobacterales bacterium RIFOXYA12_FULL_46_15]|nr:MAG: hypothetical protein A2277_00280 [Desulfobacterales bacterium RIFOXYA12_FULL_46_15]
MNWIEGIIVFAFVLNLFCIFIVFAGYPAFLFVFSLGKPKRFNSPGQESYPYISVIVVFRNAETLIEQKILNFKELDYPETKMEMILVSDGSTDQSLDLIQNDLSDRIRLFHSKDHIGKARGLNLGVKQSKGDILVFSDADSILIKNSIQVLSKYFSDSAIGGVCGQRSVLENHTRIRSGQMKYIEWDSMIKALEVKSGLSITSHDGKLYAVRKKLFQPVPDAVTDDSFISLSIIRQKYRFIFDRDAIAFIRIPSRNGWHELKRRARIVCRSLNGLKMNRELFNPGKFGFFSIGLFVNKVLRRTLPFALILFFLTSWMLSDNGVVPAVIAFWGQVAGYGLSLLHPFFCTRPLSDKAAGRFLKKISGLGFFFCLGMLGTLLGVVLFFSGKEITKWDPEKG